MWRLTAAEAEDKQTRSRQERVSDRPGALAVRPRVTSDLINVPFVQPE